MYFTLYAYNVTEQGRSMTRDLKLGKHCLALGGGDRLINYNRPIYETSSSGNIYYVSYIIWSERCHWLICLVFFSSGNLSVRAQNNHLTNPLIAVSSSRRRHRGYVVFYSLSSSRSRSAALLNYLIMKIVIDANRDLLLSVQGSNVWSGAAIQSFNRYVLSLKIRAH